MSENISIEEGGVAKNLTGNILRTEKQGGGTVDWVPKSETRLITKRITAPGEYTASQEPVESGEKPVYGYSKVTVSGVKTDAETKLVTKSITENGTYVAEDEPTGEGISYPIYGYSTVYVRVKGGGDFVDPETGETVHCDPSDNPGSGVVGTDPETGNEELIEVQDDGSLKKTELASYISIVTQPTKLAYEDGERINLSGLVCKAYKQDGTIWTSTDHPDYYPGGVLPYAPGSHGNLLIRSPLRADAEAAMGSNFDGIPLHQTSGINYKGTPIEYASDIFFSGFGTYGDFTTERTSPWGWKTSYKDISVDYWSGSTGAAPSLQIYLSTQYHRVFCLYYGPNELDISQYYSDAHIGEAGQTIRVIWPREGDRKHLETSFEISVIPSNE